MHPRFLFLQAGVLLNAISLSAAVLGQPPSTIRDKTLVAWVALADTTQRAGSPLTLIDPEEHFDAIVFAELLPSKWMAGSDFFRRTQREQATWPTETAAPHQLVQLAIAYHDTQVALYRDGRPYAAYTIDQPQTFDQDMSVLLGLRYVGSMGEIGFLRGELEEARIYDVALDAETITSLKPNQASVPQPIGQWTFEDGTVRDAMGNFPPGELRGGARIADGRLHLDGTRAYAIISPPPRPQSMFFKSPSWGGQWDTWLYYHDGTYYLYILAGPGGKWHGIGLATSRDGTHWTEQGLVLRRAAGVTWLGTGSTWKAPDDARGQRFFLNFSEWRGDRQTIFFAESTDLVHWNRLGGEYEFKQDSRWYKPAGRWDCIYTMPRQGGGLFGYWTADPATGPGVGFGQSADGVRWEALKPPEFLDGAPHGECGAVEPIRGKVYLMLGAGGMATLIADQPQGPFRPARKNLHLLTGHTYFSRFFPTPQGLLVNHHSMSSEGVYFAPLKQAVVDEEGTLRLKWWPGNESLKHQTLDVSRRVASAAPVALLDQRFDTKGGVILEGVLTLPAAAEAPPVGLYLEHGQGCGTAIRVGRGGVTELGLLQGDGTGFASKNRVDRETPFGPTATFRLLLKHSLLEFYLDDHLIQCWGLPQSPTGHIGLIHGASPESIRDLKAWR